MATTTATVYSRQQLVDLRRKSSTSTSAAAVDFDTSVIPATLRKTLQPVTTTTSYSRQQMLAIRDATPVDEEPSSLATIPVDLRRPSRFRCDSNCMNEQQHETKKILKYTRNELLRLKAAAMQSCAAQTRALEAAAPELTADYLRSLGR